MNNNEPVVAGRQNLKKLVGVSTLCALLLVSGCATDDKVETHPEPTPVIVLEKRQTPDVPNELSSEVSSAVNEPLAIFNTYRPSMSTQEYDLLRKDLGIQKDFNLMGFSESAFQTCTVATAGAPSTCRIDYYSNIHFLLLCRDAHESLQTAFDASRMQPLGNRTVKWNLKDQEGVIVLDDKGYGRIKLKSPSSQKAERLKLSIDNETLYVQAGEIGRVVTPPDWCH